MTHHQTVQPYELPEAVIEPADGGEARQAIGLGRIARELWQGRLWLVVGLVFGLGLGVAALRGFSPSYKTGVSILLDPKQAGSLGANEEFATIAVDSGKVADVEQILISSRLLRKVAEADHLADNPQFGGVPSSLPRRVLGLLTGQHAAPPETPAIRMERAIDRLGKMIRTSRVGLTYVIDVTVTAPSASQAQHLATALADAYIADQVATKYAEAHEDAAWLHARLEEIRPKLVASEGRVLEIRHQYGLFQTDNAPGSTMNRQRLTELTSELAKAQGEAAQAGAQYDAAMRTLRAGGSPDVGGSMVLDTLRTSAAEAERKLADMSAVDGPNHPARIEAAQSLATLNARVRAEALRLTDRLRERFSSTQARVASVQALLAGIVHDEAATDNVHGRALLNEAERMAQVNRTTYEATLNRLHDLEQQETRQKAEAEIISPAPYPEHPSFPRPVLCLPLGAAFGLFLGTASILTRMLMNSSLDDPELAESQLRLTVLGIIPRLTRKELGWHRDPSCVLAYMQANPHSAYADGVRRLRLSIRSRAGTGSSIVQFTSSAPGDGKSTLAASLALSASMSGVRTALVDFDLQRPSVRPMLRGVLSGDAADRAGADGSAASPADFARLPLQVMTAAGLGIPSTALLDESTLRGLIAELRRQFDLVIIDSPPVLASSDAVLVSQFVDATVLVCAVQATPSGEALRATQALRLAGAQLCGLVLNKAPISTTAYDYGYHRQPPRLAHGEIAGHG